MFKIHTWKWNTVLILLLSTFFFFFYNTFNFFDKQSAEMSRCWRGSPAGSTSVCFHKGLIFIMHYATLKNPPPTPTRHRFIKTCKRERWQEQWEGKRSWGGLRQRGHVSLRRKGGKWKKKKKKLTGQTMSLERRSCSIFVSDDGLINHSNESGEAGIAGKQKQMSWG